MSKIQPPNPIIPKQMRSLVFSSSNRIVNSDVLHAISASSSMQSTPIVSVSGIRRVAYITLAGVFFVLGMIGIVVPGLPTTPFLLLTSYFLAHSWPRMHQMLLGNKLFGSILRHWQQHRAVEPRVKLQASFFVGLAMAWLLIFSNLPFTPLFVVLAFASTGLLTIYWLPTVTQKP